MNDSNPLEGAPTWFGSPRASTRIGGHSVDTVSVPAGRWSAEHQRRLLETRTVPGLVPTLGVRRTYEQTTAHQLPSPGLSLDEAISAGSLTSVDDITGAVEASARAVHGGHLLGLTHGAIRADDVRVLGREIAVDGMGLGLGGRPGPQRGDAVAPEVAAGQIPTALSDVYSLGRVLESSLGQTTAPVTPGLRRLITEATDADPSRRPPSARAFAERLRTAADHKRHWKPFGLAALGSGAAANGLAAALSGTGSDVAAGSVVANSVVATSAVAPVVGHAGLPAVVPGAVPTAERAPATISDAPGARSGRRRLAGWALAGAAGAGLVGLYALNRDDVGDTNASARATTATSAQEQTETETEGESAEASTTTAATSTTAAPSTAAPSTTAATSTTTAPSTAAPSTAAPSTVPSPVAPGGGLTAAQADGSFEILHAVPGTAVDAYIDGKLAAAGFTPGTLAGPLPLTDAGRALQLFAAVENPPVAAADRDDAVVLDAALSPAGPGTIVAFLGPDGTPRLEPFAYDLGPVPAGQARLALQHVASIGEVSIAVDGTLVAASVAAGGTHTANIGPGKHRVQVGAADGSVLLDQVIDAPEGQLTTAWIRGGAGEDFTTSIRRIAGLDTAPTGIPSGNSGLVGDRPSNGLVASLITMMGLSGLGMALHRRWLRTSPLARAGRGVLRR